jgi:predicted ATPase
MPIVSVEVEGYRSIRLIGLPFKQINVLVGPNGCGKSNLYRSLVLLAAAASGQFARAIAEEGGMPSVLWAGQRKTGPARMKITVTVGELIYEMACGVAGAADWPTSDDFERPPFELDPRIVEEKVTFQAGKKRQTLLERTRGSVWLRDADGSRVTYHMALSTSESVLTQLREPHRFPQLSALREEMLGWRFYHHFRTDADSPVRHPQVGVFTPVLGHDGQDLAAALTTINVIGDSRGLNRAIAHAFPGGMLKLKADKGRFSLFLEMREFHRPFDARELSDGTMRYLCLLAALMTPRPPALMSLNEPEASLHPDLLEPLARLIVDASRSTQIWITTHSADLARYIEGQSGVAPVTLEKIDGETRVQGGPEVFLGA